MMEMPGAPPKGSFTRWLKGKKVLVIPHHTGNAFKPGTFENSQGNIDHAALPDETQPVVEIYSKHGTSEFLDNPRPCIGQVKGCFVRDILARGHRFGFIASSDTNQANPGSSMEQAGPLRTLQYRGGLIAVWAQELTRESIWEAILARRVYATTYPRVIIQFSISSICSGDIHGAPSSAGVPMGGIGKVPYPRYVKAEIASPLKINRIELIKNSKLLGAVPPSDNLRTAYLESPALFEDTKPSGREEDYYYLRVVMNGGEIAWSSPIWTKS